MDRSDQARRKAEPSESPRLRSQRMEDLAPTGGTGRAGGPLVSVYQSRMTTPRGEA